MDAPGILTTCAACAAPLAHDAPRCVRCKLRYCNQTYDDQVLRLRSIYAVALYQNDSATLDDLSEAVATLTDTERIARRVLGSAHPLFGMIERDLRKSRAALHARETSPGSGA